MASTSGIGSRSTALDPRQERNTNAPASQTGPQSASGRQGHSGVSSFQPVANTAAMAPAPTPAPGAQASSRPGMGAVPYDGGVMFRVWAPFAGSVGVAGDFNGWNPQPLVSEGNGNYSADFDGAKAGQSYKFMVTNGSTTFWRSDPRARQMTNSTGNSVIVDPNSFQWHHDLDFKMPPANERVIEEIHIGTFSGDHGGRPGTWAEAIGKLDDLKARGINMVEVMPVSEFPGDHSWGYNPSNLYAPESAYGSPDEMRRFVDEAHARGIGVILDVVYNHLGPSDLDLWNFDGNSLGNGGPYFYADWRANTPWGNTRPDFGRSEVRDYIRDNAMMWLREFHADGLRLDATSAIRMASGADDPNGWQVLKEINGQVHAEMPWKTVIAEDMQDNPALTRPEGAGFDAQWGANFVHPVREQITESNDAAVDVDAVATALTSAYDGDALKRVIFTSSHDEDANGQQRLPSEIGGWDAGGYHAQKKSTLAAALMLTAPGVPMLGQGQSMLEPGYFSDSAPLNWDNAHRYEGIRQLYTDLIHLRRNWFNTTAGLRGNNINVFHKDRDNKVLAYHRWDQGGPGDDTLVLVNMSGKTLQDYSVGLPQAGDWHVRLNSDFRGYSPQFGNTQTFVVHSEAGAQDGMGQHGKLTIGPYSAVILSQDR